MALGAPQDQILRLFLRHGLIVVAIGIGAGIASAVAAGQSLASLVFGVTVTDPVTLGTVAALLTQSHCSRATSRRDPRRDSIPWRPCDRSESHRMTRGKSRRADVPRPFRPPGYWRTRSLIRASVAARSWPSSSAKPPLGSDSARRLFRVAAQ